ncbi:Na+/H+ antiporter subunit A [Thermomonospora cellulosilytica]|uniref:Multicomponent Na+:H+ antiporter subunit A n=1 Tax=Thermomonospora cellulosilytica TaxID=1411118 RepID=A0A7W3MTQ1_9ACTN|nr:Na+/H+ antiporter subunit A [Thermomonospora cellulosilytica]MBA9001672.1 multicomponent Na+:H+ antiporter subunit A [Thermomonospora cellulosilytica]
MAFHAVVAVLVPWALRRDRRLMALVAALAPAVTVIWAVRQAGPVAAGEQIAEMIEWAPELGLVPQFRLDGLAWVLLLLIGAVGALVLVYSAWYFDEPPTLGIGVLVAFAGAMTGLVLADNLLVLYVFWELTTLCSYLLIGGFTPQDREHRRAANQALVMTTGFGLVMLAGLIVLGQAAGTFTISVLLADPPRGGAVELALVLILLGAFAKSAQMPLHSWLPAAMVAPSPVSAYLHAAAMVQAGVYLVARLAPGFAETAVWRPLVIAVGLVSLVVAGWHALWQDDLKRLLAYGTISQLGLLMVLCGAGTRTAALAGLALLLAHGLFKAPMFLAAGVVDHAYGTRQGSALHGVGQRMPHLGLAMAAAVASMVGIPPFLGFVAKEAALEAFAHGGWDLLVFAGVAAGSVFTVAYGIRFLQNAFGGDIGGSGEKPPSRRAFTWAYVKRVLTAERQDRVSRLAWWPIAVLSAAGFFAGLAPGVWQDLIQPYADRLTATKPYELALWHGITLPLMTSVVILALGVAVYFKAPRALHERAERLPTAQGGYRVAVKALFLVAHRLTRRTQVGSLPAYLAVIVLTVLAIPGMGLVAGLTKETAPPLQDGGLILWDNPVQAVLGLIVVAGAIAAMRVRRRLSAALLLGGVGYAMVGLFILHGAPDVALTSLIVETLTLIVLVFVLRRLPEEFPPRRRPRRLQAASGLVSAALGTFVAVLLAVMVLNRRDAPVGPEYVPEARDEGAGNVVDAILVDLRALDTSGEISVLAVAAVGVGALVLTGMHEGRFEHPEGTPRRGRWLAAPGRPPLGPPSVLLAVTARLLIPTILVFSVYLLVVGHVQPGGGFVGGLVAGSAFVLRYIAGGMRELAAALPVHPNVFIGGGLGLALVTGAAPWAVGGAFLESDTWEWTWPLLGHVKVPTGLFFDIGVYLLVLGLVLSLTRTLGTSLEEEPEQPEREGGTR